MVQHHRDWRKFDRATRSSQAPHRNKRDIQLLGAPLQDDMHSQRPLCPCLGENHSQIWPWPYRGRCFTDKTIENV